YVPALGYETHQHFHVGNDLRHFEAEPKVSRVFVATGFDHLGSGRARESAVHFDHGVAVGVLAQEVARYEGLGMENTRPLGVGPASCASTSEVHGMTICHQSLPSRPTCADSGSVTELRGSSPGTENANHLPCSRSSGAISSMPSP